VDFGFWIATAVGFVTFVVSFCLAIKQRREKDADWKWNALLALVGFVGTVVASQQGIAAAKATAALNTTIANLNRETTQAKKGLEDRKQENLKLALRLESERRARVDLMRSLAWRKVDIDPSKLWDLKEIRVELVSAPDTESRWTAWEIGTMLDFAGWKIVSSTEAENLERGVIVECSVGPFKKLGAARDALIAELKKTMPGSVDFMPSPLPPEPNEQHGGALRVLVGPSNELGGLPVVRQSGIDAKEWRARRGDAPPPLIVVPTSDPNKERPNSAP
jgi:hypothetical protein